MFKFLFLFGVCFLLYFPSMGQSFMGWQYNDRYFTVSLGTGKSGYIGELSHDKYFQKGLAQASIGVEARLLSRVSARIEAYYYNIGGNDLRAPENSFERQRNLNFKSNNFEINLSGIYYPLNSYAGKYYKRKPIDFYLHAGIGTTFFNPRTELDGETYILREYETEGNSYGKFALVLPMGFGLKFALTEFMSLITEVGYRVTFTDYLDDVSGNFAGPFDDPVRAALSNRADEVGIINPEAYDRMVPGAQRGDEFANDRYYFASVKVEAYLPADLFRSKGNKYRKEKFLKKPPGFEN